MTATASSTGGSPFPTSRKLGPTRAFRMSTGGRPPKGEPVAQTTETETTETETGGSSSVGLSVADPSKAQTYSAEPLKPVDVGGRNKRRKVHTAVKAGSSASRPVDVIEILTSEESDVEVIHSRIKGVTAEAGSSSGSAARLAPTVASSCRLDEDVCFMCKLKQQKGAVVNLPCGHVYCLQCLLSSVSNTVDGQPSL